MLAIGLIELQVDFVKYDLELPYRIGNVAISYLDILQIQSKTNYIYLTNYLLHFHNILNTLE